MTIEMPILPDISAERRMYQIDMWAEKNGIVEYVDAGYTCVRIYKDEYVTLFNLTFPEYLG